MSEETIQKMSLDEFWSRVESLNWASDNDYERIEKIILRTWDKEEALAFREAALEQRSILARSIESWEEENGSIQTSDDGHSDLLWHIVGMGREEFEKTLADPNLAAQRAIDHNYKESFGYGVPYEDTWESINPEKYINRAKSICGEISTAMDGSAHSMDPEILEVVRRRIGKHAYPIGTAFHAAAQGDLSGTYALKAGVTEHQDSLRGELKKLNVNRGGFCDRGTVEDALRVIEAHGVDNWFKDYERFMVKED